MRKLRFRAWHTEQKRMIDVYGLGIDFLTENTLDGVDPGTNAFCGDDMTPEQLYMNYLNDVKPYIYEKEER